MGEGHDGGIPPKLAARPPYLEAKFQNKFSNLVRHLNGFLRKLPLNVSNLSFYCRCVVPTRPRPAQAKGRGAVSSDKFKVVATKVSNLVSSCAVQQVRLKVKHFTSTR